MIEIAICVCLTIMGIYFVKSTDLPKELTERSTQTKIESPKHIPCSPKKMTFVKEISNTETNGMDQAELEIRNNQKREAELRFHNDEIDKLTLLITTLEQEIKVNNENNSQIQKTIDSHLITLQILQEKITRNKRS